MRSTKVLLMIVCGMGLSNINAEIIQGITKPENPEILIVNIWVNGLDYNTETVTFFEGDKRFVECKALENIGIRVEKTPRHTIKKDFCLITQPGIKVEDDYSLQAIKIFFPVDYFVGTD
ncbi:hypothetical protein [Acinetobacter lwoffii]|nr:hypothetical protein [Acinetobacter lwoffii]ENU61306.1 hypothetical protein F980_03039 [Acinetobacter lwoffii NIPH 715]